MNLELAGKHILVTGGASGIGWATVQEFLTEGAKVTILDRAHPRETVASGHSESSHQFHFLQSDITDFEEVKQTEQLAVEHFGPIDGVIHCAAIGSADQSATRRWRDPADGPYTRAR